MQSALIVELIDILDNNFSLLEILIGVTYFLFFWSWLLSFWLIRVIKWNTHLRLIRRFEVSICESIHLLSHIRLHQLQLVLLDELCEWVDLFLIK